MMLLMICYVLLLSFFQGDRAYIFQIDYEQNTTSNLFEYTEEGATPEINNLQNVSLETIQYWLDRFKVDGTFYLKSLEDEVDKNSETYRLLKITKYNESYCSAFDRK